MRVLLKGRAQWKLKQAEPSNGPFPTFIVVVEFGRPLSHVVTEMNSIITLEIFRYRPEAEAEPIFQSYEIPF